MKFIDSCKYMVTSLLNLINTISERLRQKCIVCKILHKYEIQKNFKTRLAFVMEIYVKLYYYFLRVSLKSLMKLYYKVLKNVTAV